MKVQGKVFTLLLTAGLLGVVAVLPFAFDLVGRLDLGDEARPDIPLPAVIALALVQNGVLLALAIAIGMRLSERVGLRMPLIRAWADGERSAEASTIVRSGALIGAATGVVMVAAEALLFLPRLPDAMRSLFGVPLWKRLLAGIVYGGITEELLMRLFLMSLVAWLLGKRWKTPAGLPAPGAFAAAIVVVALLFGLGHLPITSAVTPLTPLIVARALVLNGVAGLAFGWLYWRRGLEAAMVGHMSVHLVMQGPGVWLLTGQW